MLSDKKLIFAHSPDSDDAFMYYGIAKGKFSIPGYSIDHYMADIETLNSISEKNIYQVTAISASKYPSVSDKYRIMSCGSSMGRNYGPVVVSTKTNSVINEKKTELSNLSSINEKDINSKNNIKKDIASLGKTELPQKKATPIEKKPFQEFVKAHLIPSIEKEFKQRGFEVEEITLKNTFRPIAEDKCWVIKCVIKDTCNFWLSFEKEDISSSKSISLSKPNQKPSIIESFLIDEKRITLILIISRILQRLNGQKLLGVN